MKKSPLIITAAPNNCWLNPKVPYPKTTSEIIEETVRCRENGAAILHIHGQEAWGPIINGVRERTDILVQSGMSSIVLQERIELFEHKSDMASIILNHHAEAFAELNCDILHTLEELVEYAKACRQYGVKPEFEVWHSGSIWNLCRLIEQDLLDAPYINTLFFGWPGGTWSPPTVQEYLYRKSLMPENCALAVSIMDPKQMDILVAAIIHGDNVRVGTEDYPYTQQGKLATTYELVKEIADISKSLGREIATPAQAREILGL